KSKSFVSSHYWCSLPYETKRFTGFQDCGRSAECVCRCCGHCESVSDHRGSGDTLYPGCLCEFFRSAKQYACFPEISGWNSPTSIYNRQKETPTSSGRLPERNQDCLPCRCE